MSDQRFQLRVSRQPGVDFAQVARHKHHSTPTGWVHGNTERQRFLSKDFSKTAFHSVGDVWLECFETQGDYASFVEKFFGSADAFSCVNVVVQASIRHGRRCV